jgi:predicted enzyme related to lactoylglutathione lyase
MPAGGFTVWSVFPRQTDYFSPSRRAFMVNFVVDDLDGALAQVRRGRGRVVGEVQEYPYGRFGWFLDPDGNKVELWQPSAQR